ncbi:uncharacterized protein L969DRAFT_16502 [Mixia osmundae IAM 14324]|uniref:Leo1-like protein n=1 Tax=Mixia osmundae (strain CBS 9802 / IAM 14324 / JCM 22182 / KY 12970) TaxID=764103 RepID=G7E981_MIXOS|nr:uncharacterized protein L969DRAFT_16502 [Mixia osmundae IAM 14324]KEI39822.1 hypothetical protein L969DRAFT_16502 [Mixia osmundae IAM 14324]GAA99200.1 hypothetical protein E5Q_05892 [Mixia osmundae IAM 14324]
MELNGLPDGDDPRRALEDDLFGNDEPSASAPQGMATTITPADLGGPSLIDQGIPSPAPPTPSPDPEDLFGDGDDEVAAVRQGSPVRPDMDDVDHSMAGDEDDDDGDDDDDDDDGLTAEERRQRRRLEYEEDDAAPQEIQETVATVPMANLPTITSDDGQIWLARIPKFLQVDSSPFDVERWKSARSADPNQSIAEENVVRNRWISEPRTERKVRQSNSRIVRWSDGSLSLQLGTEFYDIRQSLDEAAGKTIDAQGKLTPRGMAYVAVEHTADPSNVFIETQAPLAGEMTFLPTSTRGHISRRLAVQSQADKRASAQSQTISIADIKLDPDREKAQREAQDLLKAKQKLKEARKAAGGSRRRRGGFSQRSRNLDAFSDESDEDDEMDLDEDEGRGPSGAAGTRRSSRREQANLQNEEDEAGFIAPSDEEPVVADDDDLEEEDAAGEDEDLEEEDELDAAEKRLERERKAAATTEPEPETTAEAQARRRLVIESDEED